MKEHKLAQETLDKVKTAKSVEELKTLVEDSGCKLEQAEAEKLFAAMQKSGELSEDELNKVAGGFLFSSRLPDQNGKTGMNDPASPAPVNKFI